MNASILELPRRSQNFLRLEDRIASQASPQHSLAQCLEQCEQLPVRYVAAVRVFDQLDDAGIVLQGLEVRQRTVDQFAGVFRWPLTYLAGIAFIACSFDVVLFALCGARFRVLP